MDRERFRKKRGNAKQAWLDWLADDQPAPEAKAELRERFKQQANTYQPRQHVQPRPQAPPQASVAAPQAVQQAQPVSNTAPIPKPASTAPKVTTPATVSIQIHIPAFQTERVQKLVVRVKGWVKQLKTWILIAKKWFLDQLAENKRRTIGVTVGIAVVVLGLFIPPLFNFGYGKSKVADGASSGSSTGAATYEKPPFDVVRPSSKPKLGTPDGVHAAYDGAKNSYSYSDSIGGNGFTVSQQPTPPQFKDGTTAVESIAPNLNKGVAPKALTTLFGTAYVSTNPKYNSQTVVFSIRDLLLFIQSSHAFKDTEWTDYINALQ